MSVDSIPKRPQASDSARLELVTGPGKGGYDGTWWPRSRDLRAELPGLVAALGERDISVARVSYNLEFWQTAPRKLVHNGQRIRLGGFRTIDPHEIHTLDAYGGSHLTLEVIPPRRPDAKRSPWEFRWP